MGRVSEELKALRKLEEEKTKGMSMAEKKLAKHRLKAAKKRVVPEEGLDYHWVMVRPGQKYPENWVVNYYRKEDLPLRDLRSIVRNKDNYPGRRPVEHAKTNLFGSVQQPIWVLVRGPMPNPEWGPVCP